MRKKSLVQSLIGFVLMGILVFTMAPGALADWLETATPKFKLSDIPDIKNKRQIHIALFGGTKQFDIAVPKMIKKFRAVRVDFHHNQPSVNKKFDKFVAK